MHEYYRNRLEIGRGGNDWETPLRQLAAKYGFVDAPKFEETIYSACHAKSWMDNTRGEPAISEQERIATSMEKTARKLVTQIQLILGDSTPASVTWGGRKYISFLTLLKNALSPTEKNDISRPLAPSFLFRLEKDLESLVEHLPIVNENLTAITSKKGPPVRRGSDHVIQEAIKYWEAVLQVEPFIKASGGQTDPDCRYSGDLIDFLWELSEIVHLEYATKPALGRKAKKILEHLVSKKKQL